MKTKLLYLFVGVIALTFASCEQDNVSETKQLSQSKNNNNNLVVNTVGLTPCTVANLMAGQNYDAGDLSVYFDLNNVYVEYTTTDNWYIRKTHLYVGNCQLIPRNNSGNPIPGQFPISNALSNGTQTITYTIPKSTLPACFCIAAHAEVYRLQNGTVFQSETAWAAGERFTQKSWATFFSVCQDDCFDIEDYYFGKP
ncbi:hypothetical protein WMW71_01245 [Flavobacterium buctense]|uniref:Lipoprotein n=1 Tax=Flavobacterium buctense TaxID=1648146 RepID=A0ABU9DZ54_9FLAO|nr:hypothetical protein [Flavobacterium buctense]